MDSKNQIQKREIKFRGKLTRADNNKWCYGTPCKSNYGIELVSELYHVDGAEWNVIGQDVIPETIGQFTGLQDKNGKDIYEGDIVSHKLEEFTVPVSTVEFKDGMFCFVNPEIGFTELIESLDYCEVIGNIYENPYLIA